MRRVPRWLFTGICLAVILYLTLMPDPLGHNDAPLFPGADKVVHGIMFFGLTLCMLFDALRARGWRRLPLPLTALITLIGIGVGIAIEYIQLAMALGRGFEYPDMIADAFGACVAGALWTLFSDKISTISDDQNDTHAN